MITIKQVLQFKVHQAAERIYRLKADAFKAETSKQWVYISPNGTACRSRRKCAFDPEAGWKREWVDYQKAVSCMSPRHPKWQEYVLARQEASRWLTAIHLLKLGNDGLPLKKDVRKAVRAGLLAYHVGRSRASELIFSAYRVLTVTQIDLVNNPDRYAEAERFAAARKLEASHARK